ncbi:MAG: hypothetical protein EU535_01675 [Promethearchaeota archaeon]|nr:MAG: hypothetical protein EU535_01675 [Candidatus Lokiarchaeota archaeon]
MLTLTGIFFLINAIKKKMKNMAILGIGLIAIPIGFIGNFVFRFGPIFQEYFVFIGFVCGVIFINMTFYKRQMKRANLILLIVIILGITQIILFHLVYPIEINRGYEYYLRVSLDLPYVLLVYNWFAFSFYSAYKRLKDQDIEPWIKVRYKMLAISSFLMSFHSIPEFFQPKNIRWGNPNDPISLVIFGILAVMAICYGFMFSLSWFMPKKLKRYFNKGYQREIDKEYTEEELMNMIKKQLTQD